MNHLRIAFVLAALAVSLHAQTDLTGVWSSEQCFGPRVSGRLHIDGRTTPWHAQIAGFDAVVDRRGNELRLTIPGDLGEFRGHLAADAQSISGHWIQPTSAILFQRYATPARLARVAPSVWEGEITPLPERLSFYVSIEGTSATVRNPELGWLNGRYAVDVQNDRVTLSNRSGKIEGRYDASSSRLLFPFISGAPNPVALARDANAVGFVARVPHAPYRYLPPAAEDDGWPTASLDDVGIDAKAIAAFVQSIVDADPNDLNTVPVHSLLIARHGKLVLEEYFRGFDAERTHNMRSAGKTLGPMLVGVAHADPSAPVYSLFRRYKSFANWDDRKSRMTIADVMTMTPGLACDDNDANSPGNENTLQSQSNGDWTKVTLDLPMVRDPGGKTAIYCSATLNLTGAIAEATTGRWNAELFHDLIAAPLQFGTYHLNLTPAGTVYTGGGAEIRPRDELKIGQLYLSGGVWHGRRVVDAAWVKASTTAHSRFARGVVPTDVDHEYGYGWHVHHFGTHAAYAAEGAGGQFVLVIPDLAMVVGINAGDYRSGNWYAWMLEVVPKVLMPAAK